MNVLITGGAGFIGSHLALALSKLGINVRVLDNLSPQIHGVDFSNSPTYRKIEGTVDFVRGDVVSIDDWRKVLRGVTAVVHLAAETGTGQSMYEVSKYTDVNVQGTSNLFELLANEEHSVQRLVVASSRAIYGEGAYICSKHGRIYPESRIDENMKVGDFEVKCPMCGSAPALSATDEESRIHPTSIYGLSKQVQEQMFHIMGRSLGISTVALRYQNVYGPGQSLKNPYTGIISIFSNRLKGNLPINIFEDGKESRDFVYIDDVVDATVLAVTTPEIGHQSFNVGSGCATSVIDVAYKLKELLGSTSEIQISKNYRLGDIRHNFANIERAKSMLGFAPKVNFETGIGLFVEWVKGEGLERDLYEKSIEELKSRGLYK